MDHKCWERCLNSACKIKKLCCYSYAKQLGSGKLPTKRACINNKVHKCSGGILIRPCNVTAIGINNELGGVWVKDPAHTIITPDKVENTKYKKEILMMPHQWSNSANGY